MFEYFDEILKLVLNRLNAQPMDTNLKRHLFMVILTALANNPTMTMTFLESNGLTKLFFEQVTNSDMTRTFVNTYERKGFIIGLASALNAEVLPPALADLLLPIIKQIISMLNQLKE